MNFLDTNYLIRFFTNDIESQAIKAKKLIESEEVCIPSIVLAETVYILEEHYKSNKSEISEKLLALLSQGNIESDSFAILALQIYKNESVSFYDSLLAAESINKKGKLRTFDQKLRKVFMKYSK